MSCRRRRFARTISNSQRETKFSDKMTNFIVISVCIVLVLAHSDAQQPTQNPTIDKDCLTAPSEDIDPMTCCQLPDMLESKHIDECAKKVYGSVQAADEQKNDSPFAPHIRVNRKQKPKQKKSIS